MVLAAAVVFGTWLAVDVIVYVGLPLYLLGSLVAKAIQR